MTAHSNITNVIKSIIAVRGKGNLNKLSSDMNLSYNTLVNNIRYMGENEKYDTPFAVKLCNALDITTDILTEAIRNSSISETTQHMFSERAANLDSLYRNYHQEIISMIKGLKNNDTYILITSYYPWEFKDDDLQETLLQCIKKGARFRYVYPDAENAALKKYYEGYFRKIDEWTNLKQGHTLFLEEMLERTQNDSFFVEQQEYKTNPEKYLSERLKMIVTDDPFLVHPFFKFIYIEKEILGDKKSFAFGEASTEEEGKTQETTFWFPLRKTQMQVLHKKINHILKP